MDFSGTYDLVVVGGGLLGAGIARDAAQRGLSVALFEAEDFGAGAVSRGSRLVLGGLGALGTLDFTRVREDIKEREILRQTAPHLVQPCACLVPFYGDGLLAQARLRAGLALTDALGFDQALRVHQLLSVKAARKRAPNLSPSGLLGAALVWEAAIPEVERLAQELAQDARRHGATLRPHTRVLALARESGRAGRERVSGVHWKNRLSGETGQSQASLVILAAGSGSSALRGERPENSHFLKTVSVTGPLLPGLGDVLVFPQEDAPTLLGAVPGPNDCWAGSVAAEYHDGDPAYATGAEVAALTHALRAYLPDFADVSRAEAAIHVQTRAGEEVSDAGANGGRCDGLLSASGAGIIRFRRVAEEAVDLACRKLGRGLSVPPCRTATTPLPEPSAALASADDCLTLRDFLERRAPQDWTDEQRQAQMPSALEALALRHGWDAARQAAEVKAWKAETALGQAFRVL